MLCRLSSPMSYIHECLTLSRHMHPFVYRYNSAGCMHTFYVAAQLLKRHLGFSLNFGLEVRKKQQKFRRESGIIPPYSKKPVIHSKFKTKEMIKRFVRSGFPVFGYVIRLLSNENRNLPCSRTISYIEMLVMLAETRLFSIHVSRYQL